MSATDSDNSIDWLASDNESEQESECRGRPSQAEAPSSPGGLPPLGPPASGSHRGSEAKEGDGHRGEVGEASGRGFPPSGRTGTRAGTAGLRSAQQAEKTSGKNTQQAPKRPRGSAEEDRKERQLISSGSEKNQIFRRKCMELQCYIHPLSSILNGLRSGRYKERLSSFQESVAMDRIQRIMGVLRNPCMGERYINIILKMEEMLKTWFPNIQLGEQLTVTQTEQALPTKKLKLSPEATSPVSASDPPAGGEAPRVPDPTPPGAYSASNLKWLHTSPVFSPLAQQGGPGHLLSPRDLTQDNAVSSSTDSHAKTHSAARCPAPPPPLPPPPPPPLGKINAPCLERLLMSTESIIVRKGAGGLTDSSWS
ncbi:uncharacterized protein ACO6RY_10522 [Pungitius sinensis]